MQLRNVRLIYRKFGEAKYISHLDLNRVMLRAIKRSALPVWYTEGFNPHMFITFALPLSLGFESEYEIMDFKLNDDLISNQEVLSIFKKVLPRSIEAMDVIDPICKVKDLRFASFFIDLMTQQSDDIISFLNSEEIMIEKVSKKGVLSNFDIKPKIKNLETCKMNNEIQIKIIIPAGPAENINPMLILNEIKKTIEFEIKQIVRMALLDENLKKFK